MIFVHNHPSGDPTASPEDHQLTDRLVRAGDLLGIPVLDHIVVGAETYTSFADAGWIGGLARADRGRLGISANANRGQFCGCGGFQTAVLTVAVIQRSRL